MPATPNPADPPLELVSIVAERPPTALEQLRSFVDYRDLLYFLVRRNIKARYAQTVLGLGWAVLQPLLTMVVFSIFFGSLAGIPSEGVPYPVFSLAAVVPWTYFSNSVTYGAVSLMNDVQLLKKVYFPRLMIPATPLGAGLVDLAISLGILFVVMAAYGFHPPLVAVVALPLLVLLMVLVAFAVVVSLSALGVQYRDVRFVSPFVVQLWLFVTPVIYPLQVVPERLHLLYSLNPMVGVIEGFRSVLLGTSAFPVQPVLVSALVTAVLLVAGVEYFRRVERTFADVA